MGFPQQVKRAVAAYFGGTEQVSLESQGIYYAGGPLSSLGLTSAWPYQAKGVPDSLFFSTAGQAFGAILTVELDEDYWYRQALGGPVSGWRQIEVPVICHLFSQSTFPYAEQAETAMDDLIGPAPPGSGLTSLTDLIFADRTLGTTNAVLYPNYPNNRLIEEAGEGRTGMHRRVMPAELDDSYPGGRLLIDGQVRFDLMTSWQS